MKLGAQENDAVDSNVPIMIVIPGLTSNSDSQVGIVASTSEVCDCAFILFVIPYIVWIGLSLVFKLLIRCMSSLTDHNAHNFVLFKIHSLAVKS